MLAVATAGVWQSAEQAETRWVVGEEWRRTASRKCNLVWSGHRVALAHSLIGSRCALDLGMSNRS